MYQDSDAFLNALRENGLSPNICDQIDRQGSTIGVLPVTTESVELALRGKSGIREVVDARGERVLSAYGPIELDSLRWAVLAEKDIDEAYAPIREFGRKVIIVASGMALLVSLLALACSSLLTRPLRLLTEGAKRLGAGDTGVRVNIKSKDEFGELGRVFNEMADSIKSQTSKLEDQVRENQELLLSILPASAVEQRKEGDERASRQFSDVSVLFAELIGLEEFSGGVGETKALSVLGDLIAAFDEAAEKHGIEKVKTIGGAYLAVCGLSVNRPDHVRRIIQFAQEITRIVSMFNREYRAELNILVGINSGPVVGGVVGRRKFLYDLWGDTVTIAKKLAAGSVDSQIRVTSNVRERLGDQVSFEGPFRIEVSGKPTIDAWRVNA
jgi:class 3 adenylate cyclase